MESERGSKSNELLERLRTIATIFGAVLVPVVVALVGQSYTAAIKQQESRARFVELAIEILREDPQEGEEDPLRQWAADVVNANSGTQLSVSARTALVESRALPSGGRGSVDPRFEELSVSKSGGMISILALSDCPNRSNRVTMQILVGTETHVMSNHLWDESPILRFDPADIVGATAQVDAILDADQPCTLILVIRQGSETLRLEQVELTAGENFFGMPIRIES